MIEKFQVSVKVCGNVSLLSKNVRVAAHNAIEHSKNFKKYANFLCFFAKKN